MKYIKLTLRAPFMSFGDTTSTYQNVRDTDTKPTKSMIVGLVACAMGIPRGDERIAIIKDKLVVQTTSINKHATLWQDYQNAHIRTIDKTGRYGSPNDKNIQRWKIYIANGYYVVFVGCNDDKLLSDIYNSLSFPFWPLFAGRKCCVFSEKLTEPLYQTYEDSELSQIIDSFNNEWKENVKLCICQ